MMRVAWIVLLTAVTSCVASNSVQCADGRTCPEETTCGTLEQGCLEPTQLAACEGLANGERCSFRGNGDGTCIDGACIGVVCGNSKVEGAEVCDDGNTEGGDGCSANCRSTELCGNGVIDFLEGEECDDSNLVSGDACQATCLVPRCGDGELDVLLAEQCDDGPANSSVADQPCRPDCRTKRCGDGVVDTGEVCDDGNFFAGDGCTPDCASNEVCGNGIIDKLAGETCDEADTTRTNDGCDSACRSESPVWRLWQGARPSAREQHAIVYDASKGMLLMFGGVSGSAISGETWEHDGVAWTKQTGAAPPARYGHTMAFDPTRRRVVLFGGRTGGYLNDTWEWDGRRWIQMFPATKPSARAAHAMTFDSARGRVVLFGGESAAGKLSDTWEWDGATWSARVSGTPSARSGAAAVFDPIGGRVLLYGGESGAGYLDDMWSWNGSSWTELSVTTPPMRAGHALVFDPVRNRVVLFGGTNGSNLGDAWEWDGNAWTQLGITMPTARARHAMAFLLPASKLIMTGGNAGGSEFWEYNGASWSQTPSATTSPYQRSSTATAYQTKSGRIVLFGGARTDFYSTPALYGDTWEWVGATWVLRSPAASPPARWHHAMAYEAHTGRTILFGGITSINAPQTGLADTWAWDGTTWANVTPGSPSQSPSGRYGHELVYDVARRRIVLYGGQPDSATTTYLSDTWEWNGTIWEQKTTASSPGPLHGYDLTYDPIRQRVLLFGGKSTNAATSGYMDGTWEWDGTNWTQIAPMTAPTGRTGHAMMYDAERATAVSFGGFGYHWVNDSWEWDRATWSPIYPPSPPSLRAGHWFEYDAARGQAITASGGDFWETGETWVFRWESDRPTEETCMFGFDRDGDGLRGCGDPDCWGRCTPSCPPGATCDLTLPRCGDGACNADLESCRLCPGDCGACALVCGDFVCDAGETGCPGDCP